MGLIDSILPAALLGLPAAAIGYVIGGAGQIFVPAATPEIYAALFFLSAVGYKINQALREKEAREEEEAEK